MLRLAPHGHHHAFEPLPDYAARLARDFPSVTVQRLALSDTEGEEEFAYVHGRPAWSGFLARTASDHPVVSDVEFIRVRTARLDDVIDATLPVGFIKIDVEGAELRVLQGATRTLSAWRPFVVFEHGIGAADLYGATTGQIHDLLSGCGLEVSVLTEWLRHRPALTGSEFAAQFLEGRNYYFLAHPPRV
jgi:FkbM family methyltransferase